MCLGIPGRVVDIAGDGCSATVDIDGARRVVSLALLAGEEHRAELGDWVLVHVGFAMAVIDPDEAARTLDLLRELAAADEAALAAADDLVVMR